MKFKLFFIILIFCIVVIFLLHQMLYENKDNQFFKEFHVRHMEKKYRVENDDKIILSWDQSDTWVMGFGEIFVGNKTKDSCPVSNCILTNDRNQFENADAILFHDRISNVPLTKYLHQRWIYFTMESPCNAVKIPRNFNFINWTQTFRNDSDIIHPYASFCKRETNLKINYQEIIKRKTKLAAIFVSNCDSNNNRIKYVKELMKYIPIDVFGACAKYFEQTNSCTRNNAEDCNKMLNEQYKFYLSFENSFYPGYVTEKYFNILELNVVPIVRGDANYNEIGPPKSFINTKNFSTTKDLAHYINFLDTHDEDYIEYLRYKENYHQACSNHDIRFCALCKKLNDPSEPPKVYKDIKKWFGECRKENDIILSLKERILDYF